MTSCGYRIPYGRPNIPPLVKNDLEPSGRFWDEAEDIIASGWVSNGRSVRKLEEAFRTRYNVKHAIACNNATSGLTIALKAAGWEHCRVCLPAFTWPSTLYAIKCSSSVPVWLDIYGDTWQANLGNYKDHKYLVLDTFGNQFRVPPGEKNRFIIDAAHGWDLPDLGHRGLVEVVSMSFTKLVTGMEGGMILTEDDHIAERATELRRLSARMPELCAEIALQSIQYYDTEYKQLASDLISKYLIGFDFEFSKQRVEVANNNSVFAIRFEEERARNAAMVALAQIGVETKVYYDPLANEVVTKDLTSRILAFPVHKLASENQSEIIEVTNKAVAGSATPGKSIACE